MSNDFRLKVQPLQTGELRKKMGQIIDKVHYTGQIYLVSRKGKELVAIVPASYARNLEAQKKGARATLTNFFNKNSNKNEEVSDSEVMAIANKLIAETRGEDNPNLE